MAQLRKRKKAFICREDCVACGCCVKVCPTGAVSVFGGSYAVLAGEKCVGCGRCAAECPASVITMREVTA